MGFTARACSGALIAAVTFSVLAALVEGGEIHRVPSEQNPMPQQSITDVLTTHADRLMSVPGVVGVAEGRCDGRPCIKVYVKTKSAEALRKIPSTVGGYPVSIEESGEFRAHDR